MPPAGLGGGQRDVAPSGGKPAVLPPAQLVRDQDVSTTTALAAAAATTQPRPRGREGGAFPAPAAAGACLWARSSP